MPVTDSPSKPAAPPGNGKARRSGAASAGAPAAGRNGRRTATRLAIWASGSVLAVALLVAVGIGISAAVLAYSRAEQRADAENEIRLTHIAIRRAQQQARITRAQIAATVANAEKRFQEAVGVRRAQDEISRTLTADYLQYEAIQAQQAIATSGRNNTLIYVPSGNNGVPFVQDPQNLLRSSPPR